jgi:hypothetical protein
MRVFICFVACIVLQGCYSFKGIAIPPDVKTFVVQDFTFDAGVLTAPGDLNQRFAEAVRTKIRNESRLILNENNPDIEFSGSIRGFTVMQEALQAGNTVALNRLTIAVNVEFKNNKDEKKNWNKTFSFFRTFDSTQDFLSIQDVLIREIFDQLTENVFNEAFTGW